MRLTILLLFISFSSFGQLSVIGGSVRTYEGGDTPVPPDDPVASVTTLQTYNANGNSTFLYDRFPSGPSHTKRPLILMYGGDGTDQHYSAITSPQTVTCVGTACSGTFTSPSNRKVLAGTVVVNQTGVGEIAHGYEGGLLLPTSGGITVGAMDITSNNGAYSFTLNAAGGTVTMGYSTTIMAMECGLKYINEAGGGSLDTIGEALGGAAIIAQVQNYGDNTDYPQPYYFQNVVTALETKYAGQIDYKRVYYVGTSRGGRNIRLFSDAHEDSVDAFLAATRDFPTGQDFSATTNTVSLNIMGSSDASVLSPKAPWNSVGGATSQNEYSKVLIPWGGTHTAGLWDTQVFNTATATFNWYLEIMMGSQDIPTRAQLQVWGAQYCQSVAKYRPMAITKYRNALKTVNLMSAGAAKTARLAELATLKGTIDSGRTRYVIDLGPTTSSGNINNLTSCGLASAVSNIIDDTGGSSTKTFTITNAFSSSTTESNLTTTYASTTWYGLPTTFNIDGMTVSETGNAVLSGLTAGKLATVRIYLNEVSTNYTYRAGVSCTVEGTQKFYDCQHNGLQEPLTFTDLTIGVDGDLDFTILPRDSNRAVYVTGIEVSIEN